MAAHQEDLLGAETFGCDDAAQTDGPVTDHRYLIAAADPCRKGRMMASSHHIREREQRRHQGIVFADRQCE
jgi:hypothetical protein